MTGNTGKNMLARSPAERYRDEQLVLGKNKKVYMEDSVEDKVEEGIDYEEDKRRGIARAVIDRNSAAWATFLNNVDYPEMLTNDEVLSLSEELHGKTENGIINQAKDMKHKLENRRYNLYNDNLAKNQNKENPYIKEFFYT